MRNLLVFETDDAGAITKIELMPFDDIPVPQPPSDVLFFEDFTTWTTLQGKIGDGMGDDTGKIEPWLSPFPDWDVSRLAGAPNHDIADKRKTIMGVTHVLTPDGLSLRAFPDKTSPTGYRGSMIQTRQPQFFRGTRVDVLHRWASVPDGCHGTIWFMPSDGSAGHEYDLGEAVGNNHLGKVTDLYLNAKTSSDGQDKWIKMTADERAQWRTSSLIRKDGNLIFLHDGSEVHRAPDYYDGPMDILLSWEVGPSSNGQFPGKLPRAGTSFMADLTVRTITVTKV